MSDEEESLIAEDKDRQQIPEKFSHTSFEDLQKLKERLGTKAYNETLFGKNEKRKKEFNKRRENKNGPLEMSAKIPVRSFKEVVKVKKVVSRDPRFDSLSGTFNEKAFKHSYAFVSDLRENDLKTLKKELKTTEDPKVIKKIKYLIQRLENQLREEKRLKEKQKKERQEKRELLDSMKRGEKPTFKKKSEKKILDLISQYEELKNSGKLNKHIQRLRKKNMRKDRAKLRTSESE